MKLFSINSIGLNNPMDGVSNRVNSETVLYKSVLRFSVQRAKLQFKVFDRMKDYKDIN